MNVCVPWHVRTSKFLTSLSSIQFAAKYCNSSKLLYRLESFLCQGSQLRLARESVVIRLPNSAFETSSKATFEEVSLTWEGVKKKRHVWEKFWMSFGRYVIRVNAVNCNISLSFSLFHPNIFHQFAMWVYQKRRRKKKETLLMVFAFTTPHLRFSCLFRLLIRHIQTATEYSKPLWCKSSFITVQSLEFMLLVNASER